MTLSILLSLSLTIALFERSAADKSSIWEFAMIIFLPPHPIHLTFFSNSSHFITPFHSYGPLGHLLRFITSFCFISFHNSFKITGKSFVHLIEDKSFHVSANRVLGEENNFDWFANREEGN